MEIKVKMRLVKTTPGAIQYHEVGKDGEVNGQPNKWGNKIGTLYIRKSAFEGENAPNEIEITIHQ